MAAILDVLLNIRLTVLDGECIHLEVVTESRSNPTICNNILQQAGQFFVEKVWGLPLGLASISF